MMRCRLCQGEVEKQFDLLVLGRHEVGYSRCRDCSSLQTDDPHWLADAYSASLTVSDVGAVRRCLTCRPLIWLILHFLHLRRARLLDYGGGSGLLCRLLRDIGIDAWTADPYGTSEYARLFSVDMDSAAPGSFDAVTAFEVFEHLPCPEEDLARLFRLSPSVLIASTQPYETKYDKTWWYLSPHTGQHVFFYSRSALRRLASRFGYHLHSAGAWHIFTRQPVNPIVRSALKGVLSAPSLQLCRILMEAMPDRKHVARDFQISVTGIEELKT